MNTQPDQTKEGIRPLRPRKSGLVVPHAPVWHQRLAARVVWLFIQSVTATLRYSYEDRSGLFDGKRKGPVIYAVWHNRLALCLTGYYAYAQPRNPTSGMAAMCSASKDGAFLAAILDCFRVQPVRGSTSRRGPQALLELTTWAERGFDLAITPDGPRGPRYIVQEGTTSLAQITGLPIVPAAYNLSRKIQLNTWDRFQIPLPFARCALVVGKPIRVPREATDEQREQSRLELERSLRELNRD